MFFYVHPIWDAPNIVLYNIMPLSTENTAKKHKTTSAGSVKMQSWHGLVLGWPITSSTNPVGKWLVQYFFQVTVLDVFWVCFWWWDSDTGNFQRKGPKCHCWSLCVCVLAPGVVMFPGTETKHSLPTKHLPGHEFSWICQIFLPGIMSNKTLGTFAKACKHLDIRFEHGVRSRFKDLVTFSHPNVLAMGSGKWAGKGT